MNDAIVMLTDLICDMLQDYVSDDWAVAYRLNICKSGRNKGFLHKKCQGAMGSKQALLWHAHNDAYRDWRAGYDLGDYRNSAYREPGVIAQQIFTREDREQVALAVHVVNRCVTKVYQRAYPIGGGTPGCTKAISSVRYDTNKMDWYIDDGS